MKRFSFVFRSTLIIALSATAAHASRGLNPDLIYGDDNRLEAYQVADPQWQLIAGSTAALFRNSAVRVSGSNARLALRSLEESMHVCTDEPFAQQGAGAFCSGSLVAPDLILTAGHCVSPGRPDISIETMCANTTIVFDFAVRDSSGAAPTTVPASSVYHCKSVIHQELDSGTLNDFAVIQLDRPVSDRGYLNVNRTGDIPAATPLVLIGHPSGLPVKIAGGAWAQDVSNPVYIKANTDSYGGNSGSAVINANTGEVEGILVRGAEDYVPAEDGRRCYVSNRCEDSGCRVNGMTQLDEITRVAMALNYIPGFATNSSQTPRP